ncbi:hypothetical protein BVX97_04405, partial [bacterium E08(2017)]
MTEKLKKYWKFISEDIWDVELTSLTLQKRWGVKSLRVLHLVFKGFKEDKCPLHASALTFNSLMAVMPVLALSLALARVFGGADLAERQVRKVVYEITSRLEVTANVDETGESFPKPPVALAPPAEDGVWTTAEIADELNKAVDAGFSQMEQINFAALGSVGLAFLLWMVIVVLGKVEDSFNTVWGVARGRPYHRKIIDYLFMVIILPLLITMAASFSIAELAAKFLHGSLATDIDAVTKTGMWRNL